MTPLQRIERAIGESLCTHLSDLDGSNEDAVMREAACAVLEAIREPSEGMEDAAGSRDTIGYDPAPATVWRAMIDAALREQ